MADMKKWWFGTLAAVVVGVMVAVVFLYRAPPQIPPALQTLGGDFTLQAATGPVRLSDFRGKAVLVYFGYTHCPDVCPMALGVMAAAMHLLDSRQQDRMAGMFVSLDPRRDTSEILAKYARFFDPRIVGVTGTTGEVRKVADAWRVGYEVPDQPANAHYAVEHSTFIYLVNPAGKVAALFDEKTSPEEVAAAIRQWLN